MATATMDRRNTKKFIAGQMQIGFTERQRRWLDREATRRAQPIAAIIRELLEAHMAQQKGSTR